MFTIVYLFGTYVANLFKSRRRLEVENLFLRHQLNIVLRRSPQRLRLRGSARALLVWMTQVWPSLLVWPESFNRTPSCGGIELGFGLIGAGNPRAGREGPGFTGSYGIPQAYV